MPQTYCESAWVNRPVWKSAAADHVAEREERHRRGHDEERDLAQAGVEARAVEALAAWSPSALDIAGSSAAETDMPNRLTGSM